MEWKKILVAVFYQVLSSSWTLLLSYLLSPSFRVKMYCDWQWLGCHVLGMAGPFWGFNFLCTLGFGVPGVLVVGSQGLASCLLGALGPCLGARLDTWSRGSWCLWVWWTEFSNVLEI